MKEETWIKKYGSDYKDHLVVYSNGYRSYRKSPFCCEPISNIENYELAKADNFKGWHIHHRLETHTSDGVLRQIPLHKAELIALGMYYDRPVNELIWLTNSEHQKLHGMLKDPTVTAKRVNSLLGHRGNSQTLTGIRKIKKWTPSKPIYTNDFFSKLDPNMTYTDFMRDVSKSFCIWKKFQDYVIRATLSTK